MRHHRGRSRSRQDPAGITAENVVSYAYLGWSPVASHNIGIASEQTFSTLRREDERPQGKFPPPSKLETAPYLRER